MLLQPVNSRTPLRLANSDAKPPRGAPRRRGELQAALAEQCDRLRELQRLLFADGRRALLIVLQGRDASGKDGAIRHLFDAVDPQGCEVTGFKAPTEPELSHDYLWRVHQRVPARGMIGIFNRSHYEDVLAARVRKYALRSAWSLRYRQINEFERMLSENGVVIRKFFLHVSHDEQKARLRERLKDPTKNWKFRAGDLDDRALWDAYTAAYRDALRRCSSSWAPWFVVPADDKRVRNWLIGHVIIDTLAKLPLRYPRASAAVRSLRID